MWLAGRHGSAHRAGARPADHKTACRLDMAGMIRTTLVAAAINKVHWCYRCWPEAAIPGWPMQR